ncbi:MAG TPA: hypothetical protein VKZ84_00280 [Bacteriovoracaceae bacterium]|nr:hypothetical protein [Bacteriovoracaceae bacterium]
MFILSSCLPSQTPSVKSNSQASSEKPPENNVEFSQPTFPHPLNFLQEGSTTTVNSLSVALNFNDSILIRGSSLSTYLSKISSSTVMCLVGRYTYTPGQDRYLVLSAKPMVFTDFAKKTREYYLLVQPANDVGNQNDCLTYNLQSVLQQGTSTLNFSLQQLCTNCTTAVSSTPLKIYFSTGEEASAINLGSSRLVVAGNSQQTGNSCSDNTYCQSIGYNCCLESQCANNGAIRPSAYDMPGFSSAQEDVRLNPDSFRKYPEFYFVCTDQTGTNPLPQPEIPDVDYETTVRLREMKQLRDCLNLVEGEFSYCTVKFLNASKRASKTFSSSDPEHGHSSDINFTTINSNFRNNKHANNIVQVIYSNETLYDQNIQDNPVGGVLGTPNDNLTSAQSFTLTKGLATNAKDDHLYLTYKVDGTCKRVTNSLAQCHKSFVFESLESDKFKTTYHDGSKIFRLPSYADLSATATVKVEVSGIIVPEDSTTWSRSISNEIIDGVSVLSPKITFSNNYSLYQNQTVKVTYFVKDNVPQLLSMRSLAQNRVNTICQCVGINCNLEPVFGDSNQDNIVNYNCVHQSDVDNTPPVNQTVYVSNKNAPHRYYDINGVNYDENYETAPAQEGRPFQYTNNDSLKPNNSSSYVGFNEIYGSFDTKTIRKSLPAKKVRVKKDTSYDLITINGVFSTCPSCGTDYYSALQKIFPNSFDNFGSGYTPDLLNSSRQNSTGVFRSDDLLFGRACFVPATMIPWTHTIKNNVRDQRRSRLNAQHFLFANGYQRDWYGFDYGSLIGSFDGVNWFSIGSSRRVKAKSNNLYLAVNSYFHDLNTDNSYQVSITESSPFSAPDKPDHDTESDGAQCQRSHFCSKDDDCFRQLGYEYTCQNINEIMTSWPIYDQSGNETINSLYTSLASLVGGSNGHPKRCVYRGRGAPCVNNLSQLDSLNEENIFNGTKTVGQLSCSSNNACTPVNVSRFNNKIARFANTPTAQNLQQVVTPEGDTVGLGAKIIGRPFNYNGREAIHPDAQSALFSTNINAICTPGVEVSLATTTDDLNFRTSLNPIGKSDKIFGVGPTLPGNTNNWKYLSACPATDESGYSLHHYQLGLTSPLLLTHTTTQNISSNLLDIAPLNNQKIFSSESTPSEDKKVSTIGYQRNACLRAPGASCFSDLECAPSSLIGDKFRSAGNLSAYLNQAEISFWKEDLICGNPNFKYVSNNVLNADFDILDNKCCRDIGKTLTVFTQTDTSDFKWCEGNQIQVAGLNTPINDKDRYSRVHTVYDSMTCNPGDISSSKKFALSVAKNPSAPYVDLNQILGQYKTLDTLNSRTCCTQNWIRSFHPSNGGGHKFDRSKTQTIDKKIFRDISWLPNNTTLGPDYTPFECDEDGFNNISCEIRSLTSTEQSQYLEWISSLELIGIPQVAIGTNDKVYRLVNDQQEDISMHMDPLPKTIKKMTSLAEADFSDGSSGYYSAANYDNFEISSTALKKVFSENEFNCCVPSGNEVPDTVGDSQCCTGYVANVDGPRRCCLPDFTNVSVYLNRYVSSEGRGLPDHSYDEKTGYIKDPAMVINIANQKSLCCSGTAMTGVAISKLPIPINPGRFLPPNAENTVTRFNYRTDSVDNNEETGLIGEIFDAGVRWNNQVYCVPEDFTKGN